MTRQDDLRRQALEKLQQLEVLMRDGHFDYGNGFHGRVYLNAHQLFLHPSTIWRFAQDLLDLLPAELLAQTDVVAGPATGGRCSRHACGPARRPPRADAPQCSFAPFTNADDGLTLRSFYAKRIGSARVMGRREEYRKDVPACAELVTKAGGVLATGDSATEEARDSACPTSRWRSIRRGELRRGGVPDVRGGGAITTSKPELLELTEWHVAQPFRLIVRPADRDRVTWL